MSSILRRKEVRFRSGPEVLRKLAALTAALALLIILIGVIFSLLAPSEEGQMDLGFLSIPLMLFVLLYYVSALMTTTLEGPLARPLSSGTILLGSAIFMSLVLTTGPWFRGRLDVGVLAVTIGISLLAMTVTRPWKRSWFTISRTVTLAALGAFEAVLLWALGEEGTALMAIAISLIAIVLSISWFNSRARFWRWTGWAASTPKLFGSYAVLTIITIYIMTARGLVAEIGPDQLIMVDFGLTAGCALIVASIQFVASRFPEEGVLRNMEAPRSLTFFPEGVEEFSAPIRNFVEQGEREWLVALLVRVLLENGLKEGETAPVLRILTRYQEPRRALWPSWRSERLEEGRRKARKATVSSVLNQAEIAIENHSRYGTGR